MRMQAGILRIASWLTPASKRGEWLAEWTAELRYVGDHRRHEATTFCLGAFRDAMWLRRNDPDTHPGSVLNLDSPLSCLVFLAVLGAATGLFAFRRPGPRDVLIPIPYRNAQNLVMITSGGHFGSGRPEVTLEAYRLLSDHARNVFTGVAFYRPMPMRAGNADLSLAVASGNLFDLLNLPVPFGARLILSDHAWRKHFHADSNTVGRVIEIDGSPATVVAILPESLWRLPGRVDGWLLDNERLSALPSHSKGFVLGQRIRPQRDWRVRIEVEDGRRGRDIFECATLAHGRPILAILLGVMIALLILPAVTSLSLGEYPANRSARRWGFLVLKIAIILPTVFWGALDLGLLVAPALFPQGLWIGYVLAFRWALIDQRRRCPTCLRRLAYPTRIGCSSNILLEWYGTEFICTRGHGLLHVPEIPTSAYGAQRWLQLDRSWSSLFSQSSTSSAA